MEEVVGGMVASGADVAQIMEATGLRKIDVMRICGELGLLAKVGKNRVAPATKQRVSSVKAMRKERIASDPLARLLAEGKTPKQAAIELGITHQAVYSRMKRYGLTARKRVLRKDLPKISKRYGMPMDKVKHLQRIGATRAFTYQKNNARHRGIGWELTLEQWWEIWEKSGKWERRGIGKDCYMMGRYGDVGPYAVGNVMICTPKENVAVRVAHTPPVWLQKTYFKKLSDRAET